MNTLENFKNENKIMNFLLGLNEIVITDENKEEISREIYNQILKFPTADTWNYFTLITENFQLKNLLLYHLENQQQVIFEKKYEECCNNRPQFDEDFSRDFSQRY